MASHAGREFGWRIASDVGVQIWSIAIKSGLSRSFFVYKDAGSVPIKMMSDSVEKLNRCEVCVRLRGDYELSVQEHIRCLKAFGIQDQSGAVAAAGLARAAAKRELTLHQQDLGFHTGERKTQSSWNWS